MKITEVRVRLVKQEESKLKATASVVIDDSFVVHELRIVASDKEPGSVYLAMPSRKLPSGEFRDVAHPLNSDTRVMLEKTVLDEYQKALKEQA